jgi:hypothetical protein
MTDKEILDWLENQITTMGYPLKLNVRGDGLEFLGFLDLGIKRIESEPKNTFRELLESFIQDS